MKTPKKSFAWLISLSVALLAVGCSEEQTLLSPDQPNRQGIIFNEVDIEPRSTPEEGIAVIADVVRGFVEVGSLSKSIGYSLIVELDGAASALVRGNIRDTIDKMENFVGHLCGIGTTPLCGIGTTPIGPAASAESEFLIASAQTVIDQLKTT